MWLDKWKPFYRPFPLVIMANRVSFYVPVGRCCALSQVKIQGLGKTLLSSGCLLLFWSHSPKSLKTGLLTAWLGPLAILSRSEYHTLRKYPPQFCPCLRPISTHFSNLSYFIDDKDPFFLVLWKTIVPLWEFQLFSVGSFSSSGRFLM